MRTMPYNELTERALLCSLVVKYSDVTDIVKAQDFYNSRHAKIFGAINDLREDCDFVTILNRIQELKIDGAENELIQIMDVQASSAQSRAYAMEIKKLSAKRSIIFKATELINQAYDVSTTLDTMQNIEIDRLNIGVNDGGIFHLADLEPALQALLLTGWERPLSMGWNCLDKYYLTAPGLLNIWTGAPSSGKSEFVDARNIKMMAKHSWKFCYFSPENYPTEYHAAKLLEKIHDKQFFNHYADNKITADDITKDCYQYNDYFKFVYPAANEFTLEDILSKFQICIDRYGINSVILDPWNKIGHNIPANMTEKQYISQSLDICERFAKKNNIEFNIIAHPKKLNKIKDNPDKGEWEIATAYDICGASEWYDKADGIFSIYRRYKSNQDVVEIHVQKARHKWCGTVGSVALNYKKSTGIYVEETEQTQEVMDGF